MGRSVTICAIGSKHPGLPAYKPGHEVWGINDCYQHCPEVKRFYKIYNIHKAFPECTVNFPKRYKNWRAEYEKSKALIITAKPLGLSKERVLDITKLRKDNPDYCFCSSISYAIFEAVKGGYEAIRLYRLTLNQQEYETQFPGILSNVLWAQSQGVKVYWPWLREIQKRYDGLPITVNWKYGEDINMQYGEINAVPKRITVPINTTTLDDMTVAELKKAIKTKGGKVPRVAKKDKLIEILKAL